ncbi:hypothetical protein C1Y63_11985 [Corynebacterium sp. 13CS0277]|uniref:hypothetical protein n=1 Tax=Corynebacterium sp. 13CS0277 TaxID=2071994 RepID=UPI000D023DEF|nr:hypothetical protein [Corynebacterium sp. 13CS0277]PRQ10337.1 hypothetical protein C1Y63_11985 [Corynebacterium sp. 13CS0277]
MSQKLDFANRREPIFCTVRKRGGDEVQVIRQRFSDFFNVKESAIQVWESASLATFFIEGNRSAQGNSWYHADASSVSITVHSIFEKDILDKESSAGLKKFARVINADGRDELYEKAGPVGYLFHKLPQDVAYAINDSFGFGSLYILDDAVSHTAISSSIEALALLQDSPTGLSDEYWASLQAMGHPAGHNTAFAGITKVPPGQLVTLTGKIFRLRESHSVGKFLLSCKGEEPNFEFAIKAAKKALSDSAVGADRPLLIGLSGGRDSRFVTAAAYSAGVDMNLFTYVPPELEAEVSQQLVEKIGLSDKFELHREGETKKAGGCSYVKRKSAGSPW